MRNGYYMPDLPPEYAPVIQDTSRQMKMADLLRQQSMEMPNGQMVSGHYVAPSITQYMAQMLKGYNANKMEDDALAKQQGAYDEWQGKLGEYGQKWADVIAPKVDLSQSEMPVEGPNGEITYGNTPTTVNNNEALAFLLQNPEAMNNPVIAAQAPQFLKAQEGFSGTLAPGAIAFQNGRQVAANPKADDKKPLVVDGVVLDPVTMKPLYTAPQKPEKPTADIQNYQFYVDQETKAGRTPKSYNEWNLQAKEAGANKMTFSPVMGEVETAGRKEMAKADAGHVDALRVKAEGARNSLPLIRRMEQTQGKAASGMFAPGLVGLANLANAVGLADPQTKTMLASSQLFAQGSEAFAASMLKTLMGTSNLSNTDLMTVQKLAPRLEQDPAARRELIAYARKQAELAIREYPKARKYYEDNKGSLAGYEPESMPEDKPLATRNGIPVIANDDDYARVPSGSEFFGPDGKKRRKP